MITKVKCKVTGIEAKSSPELIKKYQDEIIALRTRNSQAINLLHNLRGFVFVYTPILEGVDDILRVLKGRSFKRAVQD